VLNGRIGAPWSKRKTKYEAEQDRLSDFIPRFINDCLTTRRLPPLPNLRVLQISGETRTVPRLASILLSPRLKEFHLTICRSAPWLSFDYWGPSWAPEDDGFSQLDILRSLGETRAQLTSLRIRNQFGEPTIQSEPQLDWSQSFPATLVDLAVETTTFSRPSLAKHISAIPHLRRLELHSHLEGGTRDSLASFSQAVETMSSMPSVKVLLADIESLKILIGYGLVPQVQTITIRTSHPDRYSIMLLRPLAESMCSKLKAVNIYVPRRTFGCTWGERMSEQLVEVGLREAWTKLCFIDESSL
jgi:hypothetical protein